MRPESRSYLAPCQGQTRQPFRSTPPLLKSASWCRHRDETALYSPLRLATVHFPARAARPRGTSVTATLGSWTFDFCWSDTKPPEDAIAPPLPVAEQATRTLTGL